MRENYRYFFMDLDGTISDPKEGITRAVAYALNAYGIQVENLDTLGILFRNFMALTGKRV